MSSNVAQIRFLQFGGGILYALFGLMLRHTFGGDWLDWSGYWLVLVVALLSAAWLKFRTTGPLTASVMFLATNLMAYANVLFFTPELLDDMARLYCSGLLLVAIVDSSIVM